MRNFLLLVIMFGALTLMTRPPDKVSTQIKQSSTVASTPLSDLSVPVMYAQDVTVLPVPDTPATGGVLDFLKGNWAGLLLPLMAFLKIVVNLTPTKSDNGIFGILDTLINLIVPNNKSGGGTHPT